MFVQREIRVQREGARILQPIAFVMEADLAAVMGECADLACRAEGIIQPDIQGVVLRAHVDSSLFEADEGLIALARVAVRRLGVGSSARSCNLRPTLSSAPS